MQDRQGLVDTNQRRSLSSSCMVFLMRRSMVVSHWSNREMVSNSFTCQFRKKISKNNNAVHALLAKALHRRRALMLVKTRKLHHRKVKSRKSIFCLKRMYLQSQCRHPRSVLHMHQEVSKSQTSTS